MRTSASQRRTHATRVLLALVLGLTQMGTALHFALVRHAVASDGALVHTTKEGTTAAPNSVSTDAIVTQVSSAGCAVAALQRTPTEAPAPAPTTRTTRPTTIEPARSLHRVCDSSGTYRIAPKSSPPV